QHLGRTQQCLAVLLLQFGHAVLVLSPLGQGQVLPGLVGRDVRRGAVEDFQYLDIQIDRSGAVVVVQQDLEADGAFDRRQLAVEQGPGQELDIAGQSLVAGLERLALTLAIAPYLVPQPGGVAGGQEGQQESTQDPPAGWLHGGYPFGPVRRVIVSGSGQRDPGYPVRPASGAGPRTARY